MDSRFGGYRTGSSRRGATVLLRPVASLADFQIQGRGILAKDHTRPRHRPRRCAQHRTAQRDGRRAASQRRNHGDRRLAPRWQGPQLGLEARARRDACAASRTICARSSRFANASGGTRVDGYARLREVGRVRRPQGQEGRPEGDRCSRSRSTASPRRQRRCSSGPPRRRRPTSRASTSPRWTTPAAANVTAHARSDERPR